VNVEIIESVTNAQKKYNAYFGNDDECIKATGPTPQEAARNCLNQIEEQLNNELSKVQSDKQPKLF
jgi:hypothetical protein